MGKYLDIADKALRDMAEGQKRPASPVKPSRLYGEKSERSEISALCELAGAEWRKIASDPEQLDGLKAAAKTAAQIQAGTVPDHYTATTTCCHCGPVPIFPGCPPKVAGCPWCFSRGTPPDNAA